jgi:hypothetical protein
MMQNLKNLAFQTQMKKIQMTVSMKSHQVMESLDPRMEILLALVNMPKKEKYRMIVNGGKKIPYL